MSKQLNCWEIKNCGHGPQEGASSSQVVCLASVPGLFPELEGANRGQAQGRCCWEVSGTVCDPHLGASGGSVSLKFSTCIQCPVFQQIEREEERLFDLKLGRSCTPPS